MHFINVENKAQFICGLQSKVYIYELENKVYFADYKLQFMYADYKVHTINPECVQSKDYNI